MHMGRHTLIYLPILVIMETPPTALRGPRLLVCVCPASDTDLGGRRKLFLPSSDQTSGIGTHSWQPQRERGGLNTVTAGSPVVCIP